MTFFYKLKITNHFFWFSSIGKAIFNFALIYIWNLFTSQKWRLKNSRVINKSSIIIKRLIKFPICDTFEKNDIMTQVELILNSRCRKVVSPVVTLHLCTVDIISDKYKLWGQLFYFFTAFLPRIYFFIFSTETPAEAHSETRKLKLTVVTYRALVQVHIIIILLLAIIECARDFREQILW